MLNMNTKHTRVALIMAAMAGMVAWATGDVLISRFTAPSLVTGQYLSPAGLSTNAGSFPTSLVVSPNEKWVMSASIGSRTQLNVFSSESGQLVSTYDFSRIKALKAGSKPGLYVGICFDPSGNNLYVSRGADNIIEKLSVSETGTLTTTNETFPSEMCAGVATDGRYLVGVSNTGTTNKLVSHLTITDLTTNLAKMVDTPGYLLDVVIVDGIGYVTCEQTHSLLRVNLATGTLMPAIPMGQTPQYICHGTVSQQLLIANAGSDTLSVYDIKTAKVLKTILLRPAPIRGLPSVVPVGVAVSKDNTTAYVALFGLNAVAVVDLRSGAVRGYVPTGWQPMDVEVSNNTLFIANAKGDKARWPNGSPKMYVQLLLEGTIQAVSLTEVSRDLPRFTKSVIDNNLINNITKVEKSFSNPGIEHVIYIVKENRTYDQVLSDIPKGNRDPSLLMFGRDITPNQHALAERFVLLDNFYCSAEVSGNGWNYAMGASASPYIERNVVYGYTGKARPYDYEGTNNGVAADRFGISDVGRPVGGYIWDKAIIHNVSFRNFGMYTDDIDLPRKTAEEGAEGTNNFPTKTALVPYTHLDYRQYDLSFADSEAWIKHGLEAAPKQKSTYGIHKSPSRFTIWKRDFDRMLATNTVPQLMLVRFGNDHTAGTAIGMRTPEALVADNDYAVGQLVEAISKSKIWSKTAIFIIEDDAQNGYDHVDAHRSTAYVISPFVEKASLDSNFYNTDTVLRTIELLLKMSPMNLADAMATPFRCLGKQPNNVGPYTALLPPKSIIGATNSKRTADAKMSDQIPLTSEESSIDEELNAILWRNAFGTSRPVPKRVHRFLASPIAE